MYRIEEKDNSESPVLKHNLDVFHDALRDLEKRYHVENENGEDYDLVYYKNDDLQLDKPEEMPYDLLPTYTDFVYDEDNLDNIWIHLFDGLEQLMVEEINEYTVALIKAALKHTDMDIITNDERVNWFFPDNDRITLVEELPEFDQEKMFYVCEYGEAGYGRLDSVYNRMDPMYAFHNIFFPQWLTKGKPFKDFKYIKANFPPHVNIGGMLVELVKYRANWEPMGLKIIDNDEYMARFKREMFDKYMDLGLYNPEATDEETITIDNIYPMVLLHINFTNEQDYSPEKLFRPEFQQEMDNYYNAVFAGKKVLGVLARGTDFSLLFKEGVQDRATIVDNRLLDKVHEFIDKYGFDAIFLATEDIDILNSFKEEFGDMVTAVIQDRYSVDDFVEEVTLDQVQAKKNQHIDPEVALEDMTVNYLFALYLLSKCDSFIASSNNSGYEVAKGMNKGTYKNLFCFAYGDEISQDEMDVADTIKLSGRLDVESRDNVTEKIKNEYVEGNPLVLDFSDVDYVSTAGLSNIIELKDEFNRDVTLINVRDNIKEQIKMANLDKVFNLQ